MPHDADRPLKICMISYRSNPHSGGQGVYLKNLCRAMVDLGHRVEVVSGPPDPRLDPDIPVHRLPCLDLYDPENLFRTPTLDELRDPVNLIEWIGVSTWGFPEPYTFGLRAKRFLRDKYRQFDVMHDNQSLSYGVRSISRCVPTTVTIHHPITVDRALDVQSVKMPWSKIKRWRWYSFIPMQKRVARSFKQIITVSDFTRGDISRAFCVPEKNFRVVPNGIMVDVFKPLEGVAREANRLITTNSADVPLKGLKYLLLALAKVNQKRDVRLTVVGTPKKKSLIPKLIRDLGLDNKVLFTGRISVDDFVYHYARSTAAVVPSLYEGFGLPAGEAMACRVPVISTTGGALPEVVGPAGILVPPANADALARAIEDLLDHPEKAGEIGEAGFRRVHRHFTWKRAAEKTIDVYRETIRDYHKFRPVAPV